MTSELQKTGLYKRIMPCGRVGLQLKPDSKYLLNNDLRL